MRGRALRRRRGGLLGLVLLCSYGGVSRVGEVLGWGGREGGGGETDSPR